jgi:hypothetical protein
MVGAPLAGALLAMCVPLLVSETSQDATMTCGRHLLADPYERAATAGCSTGGTCDVQ